MTPGGLKIRLDWDGVERVLGSLKDEIDFEDALVDVELWANLPNAVSSVFAVAAALATRSWLGVLTAAVVGFAGAYLFQQLWYSRILKVLFPQFIGGWLVAGPAALGSAMFLWKTDSQATAVALVAVVFAGNVLGLWEPVLMLAMLPIAILLRGLATRTMGDTEIAFVEILSREAMRRGVPLDWGRYSGEGT